VGYVELMGDMRNVYSILVGKTEGKRPFGRAYEMKTSERILVEIRWKIVD
jgi:hypothetical protein